jgi:L-asparaginase
MRIDPDTGAAVPALSGEEIVARVHGLRKEARLTLEDYARLPGPHVTPHWMWRLKDHVSRVLADDDVDAVVLTHGTDTLEETAFLFDLTLGHTKPVVLCGAMRTVSEPGWDGPANLMAAVRTAVHPESAGRGVLIAVGEEIHAAAEATKWHTQSLSAFRSAHGPLGTLDRGHVVYHRPPFRRAPLGAARLVSEVDLHTMAAGVDDALIRASMARGARGLVLEATGCGNVPPSVLPGLRAALADRIPVVLVSRCAEGRVSPAYGYDGGGRMLEEMGVVFARDLPGPKARIKLMVALGVTSDPAEIRRIFADGADGR